MIAFFKGWFKLLCMLSIKADHKATKKKLKAYKEKLTKARPSQIINQNGLQATTGSRCVLLAIRPAQDKCPIMNQRSLFHPERMLVHCRVLVLGV